MLDKSFQALRQLKTPLHKGIVIDSLEKLPLQPQSLGFIKHMDTQSVNQEKTFHILNT